jgi:hypothetical protein
MSIVKSIQLGSFGSLAFTESQGQVTLSVTVADQAGGGSVAGFAKASLTAEVQVSAIELADVALIALEGKFPALAPIIAEIKVAMDAEAKNI